MGRKRKLPPKPRGMSDEVYRGEMDYLSRRWWRRYLSPVDPEWTWQDSPPITHVRELLIQLADLPRSENEYPPPYVEHAVADGQLRVLEVLNAAKRAKDMIDREMQLLVLELRERDTSWAVIGEALECHRQTAYEKYRDVTLDHPVASWLRFEVDAARRMALEIVQSSDSTDEQREEAIDFLERTDFPGQADTTKKLRRLYR